MAVFLPHFAILSLLTLKLCLYVATSQRQKLHVFPPSYLFILWLQYKVAVIATFSVWMLLMLSQERMQCVLCKF